MNGKELSVVLRELACSQATPLCGEWTEAWKDDSNLDELLDKFVEGQDFCIKNNYPTLEFSRKHFTDKRDVLHKHHIYFDEEVKVEDAESGTYIFVGACTGTITFKGFAVGTVYLRHTSNIKVCSYDNAKVFVSKYDDSECETDKDPFAFCRVFNRRNKRGG